MVSAAASPAKARGSFPGLGGLKETRMFLPHPLVKSMVGSLRDREVACSASDLHGLNFESCVWRAVSFHHLQEVLLAQFSLYVHKSGLRPDSFHSIWPTIVLFSYVLMTLYNQLLKIRSVRLLKRSRIRELLISMIGSAYNNNFREA